MSFQLFRNKILATVFAKLAKLNLQMELVCPPKGSYKLYVQDLQRKSQVMSVYVLLVMLLPLTARTKPQMRSYGVSQIVILSHLHIALILTNVIVTKVIMQQGLPLF